jgi:hypothetical protein
VCKRCAQSADKIKYKESLRAPGAFKYLAKYKQGVHVEEEMPETPMHEHMSEDLHWHELI